MLKQVSDKIFDPHPLPSFQIHFPKEKLENEYKLNDNTSILEEG